MIERGLFRLGFETFYEAVEILVAGFFRNLTFDTIGWLIILVVSQLHDPKFPEFDFVFFKVSRIEFSLAASAIFFYELNDEVGNPHLFSVIRFYLLYVVLVFLLNIFDHLSQFRSLDGETFFQDFFKVLFFGQHIFAQFIGNRFLRESLQKEHRNAVVFSGEFRLDGQCMKTDKTADDDFRPGFDIGLGKSIDTPIAEIFQHHLVFVRRNTIFLVFHR